MKLRVEWSPGRVQEVDCQDTAPGVSLATLLREHGLPLNTRCGGEGTCAGCRVELLEGVVRPLQAGDASAAVECVDGIRRVRACRVAPDAATDLQLRVPPRARGDRPLHAISLFRWTPTASRRIHETAANRAGNVPSSDFGAAVDVGTTTVAVAVFDRRDGRLLGHAASYNEQIHHGEDVITRIAACTGSPARVRELQEAAARRTVRPLLDQACRNAGIHIGQLAGITVAGNTTMLHLLAGVDPTPLGTVPFRPAFLDARRLDPAILGLPPSVEVICLPGFSAFVGADVAAGAISSGLLDEEGPGLLVDAGTNGELLLKDGPRLIGASTALGPAFEGSGLSHGVRAAPGAIAHVRLRAAPFAVEMDTIDRLPPDGICGSAYIDFLAEARRLGLLTPTGRFSDTASALAAASLSVENGERGLLLARDPEGLPIRITERDVARLLQAKAALATGVDMLLQKAGRRAAEIRHLYLAGGFGLNVSPDSAIACGLLPGFRTEQIRLAGNASLGGAALALLVPAVMAELQAVTRGAQILALNLEPDFEDGFIGHLALP